MQIFKKKQADYLSVLKPLKTKSSGTGLISRMKYSFSENKFIKGLSIAGFGGALLNTFGLNMFGLMSLVQLGGEIAGAYAISNALKGNQPIQYKSNNELTNHIVKSGLVLVGGAVLTSMTHYLPFGNLFSYFTMMITLAGLSGVIEAGIEKYRR